MPMQVEFCSIHSILEDAPVGSLQCMECGHVFKTPRTLVMDWNAFQQQMAETSRTPSAFDELLEQSSFGRKPQPYEPRILTDPDDVPFCPHCLHNF